MTAGSASSMLMMAGQSAPAGEDLPDIDLTAARTTD